MFHLYMILGVLLCLLLVRIVRYFWKFPAPFFILRFIDNPVRRRLQPPKLLADRMDLRPDMTVLEVGPGEGSYTLEVARRVPEGKVVAVDIQESVVKKLREKCEKFGITNVEPAVMDIHNLKFKDETFDRIFLVCCLPEVPDPIGALCELHRVLKPNGLLCLSEYLFDPDYPLCQTEIKWAEKAGFTLASRYGGLLTYQLNFQKSQHGWERDTGKRQDKRCLTKRKPARA